MLPGILADIRYAARSLTKAPAFLVAAILTLALGIGVNVAVVSLYQQVLLQPLPVAEPGNLVNLSDAGPKPDAFEYGSIAGGAESLFNYPMFRDLEREQQAFTGIAAHRLFDASISTGLQARQDTGMFVSGAYFSLLGLQPALGRLLGRQDAEEDGQAQTVVLSYAYWQSELGGNADVIGDTLIVNGKRLTIVGIAPVDFHGTTAGVRAAVFVPISFRGVDAPLAIPNHDDRSYYWLHMFARLRPGISPEQATVSINTLYRRVLNDTEAPLLSGADAEELEAFGAKTLVLEAGDRGQSRVLARAGGRLRMLFAVSGGLLILCCANIAGLMMVRGSARTGEMAVRASMGATKGRLARQLLVESLPIAVPSAIASFPVAIYTLRGIASSPFGIPAAAFDAQLNFEAALAAIGISLISAAVFGLVPLGRLARTEPAKTIQGFSARQTTARGVARFRRTLATTQVALAMALLGITGVFVQSLGNISRIDPGLDLDSVVMFSMSPETSGYAPEASAALFDQLEQELVAIPGAISVGSSMVPLLGGGGITFNGGQIALNYISPDFFRTLDIGVLAGRDFNGADVAGSPAVAIVNRQYADRLLAGRDAIGERVAFGNVQGEIVGLVSNAKYDNITRDIGPQLFLPRQQLTTQGSATFYIRGELPAAELMRAVRDTVVRIDPIVPITGLRTMQDQVRENISTERYAATMASISSLLATLLAAIGLYGVLAFSVSQRAREIALRMALGATADRIRGAVLRQVATMATLGVFVGIIAAILLGRAARSLIFGVDSADPLALFSAAAILVIVTLGAAYFPTRRASRVDPMAVLRYE